jgi:alkaline phosphatase D
MATGLGVAEHGLLSSYFYAPRWQKSYSIRDRRSYLLPQWYQGTPLWMALANGRKSAAYFWPGTEIFTMRPAIVKAYDGSIPNQQRMQEVLAWLRMPEEHRPQLVMLYFSTPDSAAQKFGIGSPEFMEGIQELDQQLGQFIQTIQQEWPMMDIIIVSDHGMVPSHPEEQVFLEELVDLSSYIEKEMVYALGPMTTIYEPDRAKAQKIKDALALAAPGRHYQVFLKDELPEAYHYQHEFVGDIIVIADCGYSVTIKKYTQTDVAAHGYAPWSCPAMDGIFMAQGPHFKPGKLGRTDNRQLYPLVLGIYGLSSRDPRTAKLDPQLQTYLQLDPPAP